MIALVFFSMVFLTWMISSWSIMLLVGMVHHEILQAVIPISYAVSMKFSLVVLGFTLAGYFIGGLINGLSD